MFTKTAAIPGVQKLVPVSERLFVVLEAGATALV
jgi:hypothetical protein